VITAPEVVCAGVSSRFSAGDSYDEDGEIAAYEWHFGDGVTAEGKTVDRVFQTPGVYDVILAVDDGTAARNARARTLRRVRVEAPLHPEAGPDRIVSPEERVSFTARHTPNPEDVRFQYKWDFGNNQAAEGEQVDIVYKKPGTYTVRLLVDGGADVSCRRASDTAKVRVNAPPVADAGGDKTAYTGGANDQVVFNAGRSSDPDGDPLTYTWDFGDNTTGSGKMTTHAYRRAGRYRVTLTVDDGLGLSSSRRSDSITVVIKER
jgi:PKD repeat protein